MTNVTKMKIMRNHEKKMTHARITEKNDKHKTLRGINITNGKNKTIIMKMTNLKIHEMQISLFCDP